MSEYLRQPHGQGSSEAEKHRDHGDDPRPVLGAVNLATHVNANSADEQTRQRMATPSKAAQTQQLVDNSPRMVTQAQKLRQFVVNSNAPIQRMLIKMMVDGWSEKQKATINRGAPALASAHNLGAVSENLDDIANLVDEEELWLYSHGSSSRFGRKTPAALCEALKGKLRAGKRKIVLKGCKSRGVADALQELLRQDPSYAEVVVLGMPGTAHTSSSGAMTVSTPTSRRKGKVAGSLAQIRALRGGASREDAERIGKDEEKSISRIPVEIGDTEVSALDDREMRRRNRKRSAKNWPSAGEDDSPTTTTQTPVANQGAGHGNPQIKRPRRRVIEEDDDDDVAPTAVASSSQSDAHQAGLDGL